MSRKKLKMFAALLVAFMMFAGTGLQGIGALWSYAANNGNRQMGGGIIHEVLPLEDAVLFQTVEFGTMLHEVYLPTTLIVHVSDSDLGYDFVIPPPDFLRTELTMKNIRIMMTRTGKKTITT